MYHSITFGDMNTWDDWHLIPKSRPTVNPPIVKTNYIEIPGSDGVLDLTTALTRRPLYKNRTGTFDFYTDSEFKNWVVLYSEIMAYLQGKKLKMVLEDDPSYYYEGRFIVTNQISDPNYTTISISYDVGPYKRNVGELFEGWLWDELDFETGIIREYKDRTVNGITEIQVIGVLIPLSILIHASNSTMSVIFHENIYPLKKGVNSIPEIVIVNGENLLTFSGTGKVSIEYLGGLL